MKKLSEWFRIDGDNTLRLDYPLKKHSGVWDVGGYKGDFAHKIYEKFGCPVLIFEPVYEFAQVIKKRFKDNPYIVVSEFGLSDKTGYQPISVKADSSSTLTGIPTTEAPFHDIAGLVDYEIDLIKINIEGGEYALLNRLLDTGKITNFKYIQVQFHTFVEGAEEKRNEIREKLKLTHKEMWNYNWVWESWERK